MGMVRLENQMAPAPARWILCLLIGCSAFGCAFGPARPEYNPPLWSRLLRKASLYPNPMLVPVLDPDFAWDEIVDTVDDYFRIRQEERVRLVGNVLTEGRIETYPEVASTLFEPWRHDSANFHERLVSTTQSMRRYAIVRVIPDGRGYLVSVAIMKELEDVASPEHATAGAATFRHDQSVERYTSPVAGGAASLGWIVVGRDTALEQRILGQLHAKLIEDCQR